MSEYSLGDALNQFIKRSHLKNGIRSAQIVEIWEKVMGKTIALYTDKIEIVQSTLFISTNNASLKQELLYQRSKILQSVNEELGDAVIRQVVIR